MYLNHLSNYFFDVFVVYVFGLCASVRIISWFLILFSGKTWQKKNYCIITSSRLFSVLTFKVTFRWRALKVWNTTQLTEVSGPSRRNMITHGKLAMISKVKNNFLFNWTPPCFKYIITCLVHVNQVKPSSSQAVDRPLNLRLMKRESCSNISNTLHRACSCIFFFMKITKTNCEDVSGYFFI